VFGSTITISCINSQDLGLRC